MSLFRRFMQVLQVFLLSLLFAQSLLNRGLQPKLAVKKTRLIGKQHVRGATKANISTMILRCAQLA
ncbi:hypothetical protein C2E19_19580 [Pseudomonas sp. DTU12.3]|nr:hypothetical protein C2E19_19580 [Pseudomonas sp. DTU12.3]